MIQILKYLKLTEQDFFTEESRDAAVLRSQSVIPMGGRGLGLALRLPLQSLCNLGNFQEFPLCRDIGSKPNGLS